MAPPSTNHLKDIRRLILINIDRNHDWTWSTFLMLYPYCDQRWSKLGLNLINIFVVLPLLWSTLIEINPDFDQHFCLFTLTVINVDRNKPWFWSTLIRIRVDSDQHFYCFALTVINVDRNQPWFWSTLIRIKVESDQHFYCFALTLITFFTASDQLFENLHLRWSTFFWLWPAFDQHLLSFIKLCPDTDQLYSILPLILINISKK